MGGATAEGSARCLIDLTEFLSWRCGRCSWRGKQASRRYSYARPAFCSQGTGTMHSESRPGGERQIVAALPDDSLRDPFAVAGTVRAVRRVALEIEFDRTFVAMSQTDGRLDLIRFDAPSQGAIAQPGW